MVSVSVPEAENSGQPRLVVLMLSGHYPPIQYSDVQVRVYDQPGGEIASPPTNSKPDVYKMVGDAEQSGDYSLKPSPGRIASVAKVIWRHTELTFAIPQAWAALAEGKDESLLEVKVIKGNEPAIKYNEVNVRAFDKRGPQINLVPVTAQSEAWATSADDKRIVGRYHVLPGQGQKVGYVYFKWKDAYIGFYVPEGIDR